MSFHKKVFIGFLIFHAVFTVGGLIAGFFQTVPEATNDRDKIVEGVWPYVWVLFGAALSMVGLVLTYLIRATLHLRKRISTPRPAS